MTNTGIHIPEQITAQLTEARETVRRIELVSRYLAEAELQGLGSDDAFLGADAVLVGEDVVLCLDVRSWEGAQVEISLSRIVPDEEYVGTEELWSVRLTEVPWQLFSVTLAEAIKRMSNS